MPRGQPCAAPHSCTVALRRQRDCARQLSNLREFATGPRHI